MHDACIKHFWKLLLFVIIVEIISFLLAFLGCPVGIRDLAFFGVGIRDFWGEEERDW